MWVVKAHGKTYYVNHVECSVPWSTKETKDNPHTKGSIKIKKCLLLIDAQNNATISNLTMMDKFRLRNAKKDAVRIIFDDDDKSVIIAALAQSSIGHGLIKRFKGACSTTFYITEIFDKAELAFLYLIANDSFRELAPNEEYYSYYNNKSLGVIENA
jgi:hypothetical protein